MTKLLAATAAATLAIASAPAGKGGKGKGNNDGDVGGNVSGVIFSQVAFDDTFAGTDNYLVSDDGTPYLYGVDMVEIVVGRNRAMNFDFNTHKKKASLRKLRMWGDLPTVVDAGGFTYDAASLVLDPGNPCTPALNLAVPLEAAALDPDLSAGPWNLLPDAHLDVSGEDHDDAAVGCVRYLNATLTFTDNSGETWHLYFGGRMHPSGSFFAPCSSCLQVTRLPNTLDGSAQWRFATEEPHLAYLYHDNRPPHAPSAFHSIVQLPFSGVVSSLTQEAEPAPGDPATHCWDSDPCPPTPIVLL